MSEKMFDKVGNPIEVGCYVVQHTGRKSADIEIAQVIQITKNSVITVSERHNFDPTSIFKRRMKSQQVLVMPESWVDKGATQS